MSGVPGVDLVGGVGEGGGGVKLPKFDKRRQYNTLTRCQSRELSFPRNSSLTIFSEGMPSDRSWLECNDPNKLVMLAEFGANCRQPVLSRDMCY